jgi:glutamine synthetase
LELLARCDPMRDLLGDNFVKAFISVKEAEYEAFFRVISSWEHEYLLLHV